ncbi:4-coumarate--CoA ligase [Spirosoma sp. HMF3257]|uniref:4-coumarate--CoA ligase n=1 Tax=Spirosoma telluris TaxID=2183553 RepID=A0A327NLR6_9BACT|nr:4-coumarate--CoA ligase [Spirosoma telluris]RAI73538.1 4-coumarate--CoA ligase [Spirosoma telluris]
MIWTPANVQRIILDSAGRILQKPHAGLPTNVPAELDLQYELGLDSLQRMELAAQLNEFFGIFETSAENYLLRSTTLDHWTRCILRAREQTDNWLTFRTSGTSGISRSIRHSLPSLLEEARFLSLLLPIPDQIISCVASNHIYGFIFTILLPVLWQRPLRLVGDISANDIQEESLLIGTPFTWEWLNTSLFTGRKVGCQGVCSTSPLPPALYTQLQKADITLTEIYGSSDTGGIGYRKQPDAPFVLFPYLTLLAGDPGQIGRIDTGETFIIPDRLEQVSPTEVRLLGRLDESISIAGVNVYPAHVRQVIENCPLVADCDVYAKAEAGVVQLYGAVRLRVHNEANRQACQRWIQMHLSACERPKHLYLY